MEVNANLVRSSRLRDVELDVYFCRTKYDVDFFKQFRVVMNALDNMGARSHVNRMCLAANLPLIESASAGFKGNVTVSVVRHFFYASVML